jgi:glutamine amidotransferase
VQKAFERTGHAAAITSQPRDIERAEKVVLPGVGAFADAMAELRRRHLLEPIREAIDSGRPFLGICLGMQLLFEVSHEDGQHEGLGVVGGEVRRFVPSGQYKVPHMGWNEVSFRRRGPIFSDVDEGAHFYFVHSYYVAPFDANVIDGEASYPEPFCATIWRDNLFATQFHPEKSQAVGLQVLKNFAAL